VSDRRLHLVVLTPASVLLEVPEVKWIQARLAGADSVGIHPGHAPLLAETRAGPLRYGAAQGAAESVELEAGILQVTGDDVLLFTGGRLGQSAAFSGPAEAAAQRFDRLAAALLNTLRADPGAALETDDAEADGWSPAA